MKHLFPILILIILIACKMDNQPKLSLIKKAELLNFPSASAIEFYNDRLYVIGDDARNLAILDKQYNLLDSVELFPGESLRIPKKSKTDLEASTIVQYQNKAQLLVAGSAATPEREYLLLFPLDDLKNHKKISTQQFTHTLKEAGLKQVNIEGLVSINNIIIFGNRGNRANPENHLIFVSTGIIDNVEGKIPRLTELNLSEDGTVKGLSGLAYIPSMDLLLFTASIEDTDNAFDDGGIGHSYLGIIHAFSSKMNNKAIIPDELWNLSEMNAEFNNEKIESVAVESAGNELILHLVSDNDDGTSTLFKLSLQSPL
jgi:hypothetical protein